MMTAWLTLAAAITTSLCGQILLKAGASGSVAAEAGFIDQLFRWQTIVGLGASSAISPESRCGRSGRCSAECEAAVPELLVLLEMGILGIAGRLGWREWERFEGPPDGCCVDQPVVLRDASGEVGNVDSSEVVPDLRSAHLGTLVPFETEAELVRRPAQIILD